MGKDIRYDKLMKLKSLYKTTHLYNPKILSIDNFEFPMDSIIHWFKVTPVIDHPSSMVGYFKNNKLLIETILEYPKEGTIGKFTYISTPSPASLIKDASKQVKEFKWLQPTQTLKLTPKVQLVYNYGALLSKYKYPEQMMRWYSMYYNSAMAMMNLLLSNKRNTFLVLDLPSTLLSKRDLNRFASKLNNGMLTSLPTTAHLNLLELWKLITPEFTAKSVFNIIPPYFDNGKKDDLRVPNRPTSLTPNYYEKINLLLVIDTKCVLINLRTLMSFVEEYKLETKTINPLKYQQFCVKFLEMLQMVIDNAALSEEELEKISTDEDSGKEVNYMANGVKSGLSKIANINIKSEKTEDEETQQDLEEDEFDLEDLTGYEAKEQLELEEQFKSLDDLIKEEYDYNVVDKKLDNLKNNKLLSSAKYNSMKKTLEEQKDKDVPYKDMKGVKLKDVLDSSKDNYNIKDSDQNITDNKTVFDKSYNKNTAGAITKNYVTEQLKKDILRSIYAVQNADIIVENYEINEIKSIMGEMEEHVITLKPLNGSPSTVKLVLPKVDPNNMSIKLSSNTYFIRRQKSDVPVRKTEYNKIMLSTYYGKMSIYKAKSNYDNIGYWLMNTVVKLANHNDIKDLVLLNIKNPDVHLPLDYTHFSRFIKSFKYKGSKFLFDYAHRGELLPKLSEKDIESLEDGVVLVGAKGNNPIVMDYQNRLFEFKGNKFEEMDNLYELLGIDKSTSPIEFVTIKVVKKDIPVVVLLAYYLGLENLLKLLNVTYSIDAKKSRDINKYNSYIVGFKDSYLHITRDHGKADLILSGLLSIEKILKDIPLSVMNSKNSFEVLFTKMQLPLLYVNEIKLLETMYVDPISATVLKQMKEPTNFKGLLIRAAEMLVDDTFTNANSMNGVIIKGYERIAGMVYKELATAIKEHENRTFFSKSKITTNPYAIVNKITEDSTTDLADDLNPMASIKQKEDVSSLGAFGRIKDAMSKDTRVIHDSEIGVISEATRDSSDVGITAYLTADPKLSNTRGMVDNDKKNESWANVLSTSALLAPFALNDDVKRLKIGSIA